MALLKTTRHFLLQILGGANVMTIALMLIVGYSGCVSPGVHPVVAVMGLSFPVFVIANVLFFIVWAFVKRRYMLIPAVGMLLSMDLMYDYSPIRTIEEHPEGCIKVLSYNTMSFAATVVENDVPNPVMQYVNNSGADIVCIQEYGIPRKQEKMLDSLRVTYQYQDTLHGGPGADCIAVLSKYPIRDHYRIPIESKGNIVGVFRLDVNGTPVNVINLHLETVGFSMDDKDKFRDIVKGNTSRGEVRGESRQLMRKLAHSGVLRASQARAVAEFIKEHEGEHILVCGDFNDHPLSYTQRTIRHGLTDCYRATSAMPGFTYSRSGMRVRIDNIMCSDGLQPYECKVDKSIDFSDHYPIFCYFKFK